MHLTRCCDKQQKTNITAWIRCCDVAEYSKMHQNCTLEMHAETTLENTVGCHSSCTQHTLDVY